MLLIHTCCADCTLRLFTAFDDQSASAQLTETSLYYYAPNIHPRSEYLSRLVALKRIIKQKDFACQLIVADYQPKDYFLFLKKHLKDLNFPPQSQRCQWCWQLRLEKSFIYAKQHGFNRVTSTMLSSCYMNRAEIIKLGKKLAKKYQIEFIIPQISCDFLKTKGFYKQNYCGCCFSLVEKITEKYRV